MEQYITTQSTISTQQNRQWIHNVTYYAYMEHTWICFEHPVTHLHRAYMCECVWGAWRLNMTIAFKRCLHRPYIVCGGADQNDCAAVVAALESHGHLYKVTPHQHQDTILWFGHWRRQFGERKLLILWKYTKYTAMHFKHIIHATCIRFVCIWRSNIYVHVCILWHT